MANKKRAAVPKPAVKAKPTEDQLEKARIEKEKQDKLAKMKELYEKGSSLIDIGKLHRHPPAASPRLSLEGKRQDANDCRNPGFKEKANWQQKAVTENRQWEEPPLPSSIALPN